MSKIQLSIIGDLRSNTYERLLMDCVFNNTFLEEIVEDYTIIVL